MIRIEQHGDVTRLEMSSRWSRAIGYTASAYLVRGVLIDCGFHGVGREVYAILAETRPRGLLITHYHEDHAGNVERVARLGIPIAASTDTFARLRSPAQSTRRACWIWVVAPSRHQGTCTVPAQAPRSRT